MYQNYIFFKFNISTSKQQKNTKKKYFEAKEYQFFFKKNMLPPQKQTLPIFYKP
jgi:hypothetical protein